MSGEATNSILADSTKKEGFADGEAPLSLYFITCLLCHVPAGLRVFASAVLVSAHSEKRCTYHRFFPPVSGAHTVAGAAVAPLRLWAACTTSGTGMRLTYFVPSSSSCRQMKPVALPPLDGV